MDAIAVVVEERDVDVDEDSSSAARGRRATSKPRGGDDDFRVVTDWIAPQVYSP